MTGSPANGRGRRQRGAEPRRHPVKVFLSASEKATLAAAAGRDGLALGAFIAIAATERAEYRAAPVDAVHRAALAELIEIREPLRRSSQVFAAAAGLIDASDAEVPDLGLAAEHCMQVVARVNQVAARLLPLVLAPEAASSPAGQLRPAGPGAVYPPPGAFPSGMSRWPAASAAPSRLPRRRIRGDG